MMDISLQLYSLRNVKEEPKKLLNLVAGMGYTGVELAGYYDLPASEFKKILDDNGLKVVGSHIGYEKLRDSLDYELEYNLTVGNHRLILPYYKMESMDDAKRAAEFLNETYAKVKNSGAKIGYHNHSFEFETRAEGKRYIDVMLAETIPEIFFEFDVYWVSYADQDPIATIKANAGRVDLVHLKELAVDLPKRNVEIGSGKLDFAGIIKTAKECGTADFVVEQEDYTLPDLDSCKASFEGLKKPNLL